MFLLFGQLEVLGGIFCLIRPVIEGKIFRTRQRSQANLNNTGKSAFVQFLTVVGKIFVSAGALRTELYSDSVFILFSKS